jgi:hypothetical protein
MPKLVFTFLENMILLEKPLFRSDGCVGMSAAYGTPKHLKEAALCE